MIMSVLITALALAAEPLAPAGQETAFEPAPISIEAVEEKVRLDSKAIAALLVEGGLPDYCEAYYFDDPITGERQCSYVVCRPRGVPWSLHECFEFGLD